MTQKYEPLSIALFSGFVLLCVGLFVNLATAETVHLGTGTVIDKVYSPATSSSGMGFVSDSNGGVQPVHTHSSTPEKWVVIVSFEGETFSSNVDAGTWGRLENGRPCTVSQSRGCLFSFGRRVGVAESIEALQAESGT